jgi:putative sigma-54 modulation protein|uniref:Ribosome-associated translation inhibitor RaiA n=1 Tax=candidate division WOR-3 bacterium TaxID=2052148 RepID=A0A7C4TIU6_UNCW3
MMNIRISARNFTLTDALTEFAGKKLAKLKRFEHHIIDGTLVLEKDKAISLVELNLQVKHSKIVCRVNTQDIYQGIIDVAKKAERQLQKYEDKFKERKRLAAKKKRE